MPMHVGCILTVMEEDNVDRKFQDLKGLGISRCQVVCWDRRVVNDEKKAREILEAAANYETIISAFWCGWEGPRTWDFYDGQETLGLVPPAYRFQRMQMLKEGSDFAKELGVSDLVTHVGYMPENPHDANYPGILAAVKDVAGYCGKNGQYFLFETGQETPVTLLRAITDIGLDNLGVNLDPANLIMYGKANPVDALDTIGPYVRNIHGKDGCYPTDGRELGAEVPIGKGRVNFPLFIKRLKEIGYEGDITIEREIEGDEQTRDILMGKKLLEKWIGEAE